MTPMLDAIIRALSIVGIGLTGVALVLLLFAAAFSVGAPA